MFCETLRTAPDPEQVGHVRADVPGSAPLESLQPDQTGASCGIKDFQDFTLYDFRAKLKEEA